MEYCQDDNHLVDEIALLKSLRLQENVDSFIIYWKKRNSFILYQTFISCSMSSHTILLERSIQDYVKFLKRNITCL